MLRKAILMLLLIHSLELHASKAYITDVFGGQVFVETNGTIETVSLAPGVLPFVSPSYVSVSAEGTLAYVNDYNAASASIYSIDTRTNIASAITNSSTTPFSGTFSCAFSPTEPKAYVGAVGVIYVVDTRTHTAIGTVTVAGGLPPIGSIFSLAFSNDGSFAYATAFNDGVYVIDTSSNTASSMITTALGVPDFWSADCVAMNPKNSAQAYVGDNAIGAIFVIDNTTKQAIGIVSSAGGLPSFTSPYDVAYSRDGQLAYVADNGISAIFVIDTRSNQVTHLIASDISVPPFSNPLGVSFSPDGIFALATDVNESGVFYIDIASNTATAFINLPGSVSGQGVNFVPAPLPPPALRGHKKKNEFGTTYTLNNVLDWDPSPSHIVNYNIYFEGNLMKSVTGLTDIHRNVLKRTANYSVTANDIFGIESDHRTVSIK